MLSFHSSQAWPVSSTTCLVAIRSAFDCKNIPWGRMAEKKQISIIGFMKVKETAHMVKIGLFCCGKVAQKLGCSCTQCLYDLRNRVGSFDRYSRDTNLELVGLVQCPGCPAETKADRLSALVKNLVEYQVDVIHFSHCLNTFCVFRYDYASLIERDYPEIEIVLDTGLPNVTHMQNAVML